MARDNVIIFDLSFDCQSHCRQTCFPPVLSLHLWERETQVICAVLLFLCHFVPLGVTFDRDS